MSVLSKKTGSGRSDYTSETRADGMTVIRPRSYDASDWMRLGLLLAALATTGRIGALVFFGV